MKTLFSALLEYNNTPKEFRPYLCLHPNGKYQVINWSNKKNIETLMGLKVVK